MANEKSATVNLFFRELFQLGVYKRSQGRIARQATFAVLAVVIALGCWRLSVYQVYENRYLQYGIPGILFLVGLWVAYRVVNIPAFADFLIAVEAEMNKVSWPTKLELWRSVMVVIVSIGFLAVVLWGYDIFWRFLLGRVLGVG